MRNLPQTLNRGIVSCLCGLPGRCSTFRLNGNRILRLSFSTCLRVLENHNREFNRRRNTKKIEPLNESKEPRCSSLEVSGNRGIGKSRVKWYSEMLRNFSSKIRFREGKVIHGSIIRTETEPDSHLWVSLINLYVKCGALEVSCHVFEQMPVKDVVSWTALISGFVSQGRGVESVNLFVVMRRADVRPNEFTLATILKGTSLLADLDFGKQVHTEVVKIGVHSDVYIGSSLIDLYSRSGEMKYADAVFRTMPEKNAVLWNSLLNGYAQVGNGESVLGLFCEMTEPEMRFSSYTLSVVLKGIAGSGAFRAGQAIHSTAIKVGGNIDDFVRCSLVNMYSKCGLANDALKVFKIMKDPDIVAWSSIISVLDHEGLKEEAAEIFNVMRRSSIRPNQFTLSTLASVATGLGDLQYGKSIHALAHKFGFESDDLVCNAFTAMYMKLGSISDGYRVFDKMTNRDVISWNAVLSGLHDDESFEQGTRIFKQMLSDGFCPNIYTFVSILRSCSSLLRIEFGKQVHTHIIKENFVSDVYVGTALIDIYAKCGSMGDMEAIFRRLDKKDIFTWTVIISGYSQHNEGEKSARCFNEMRREGVIPNEFTVASCLRGCSGIASLVSGRQLHSLTIKSGLWSDMYVSSQLIDMYGKCGYIDDAEYLFNGMKQRDIVTWNTIINGYSQHGEGEKALQVFEKMINEGVPPDGVTFVGILSACSHMGLVEEGNKLFYSMSESYGITPGIEHYACFIDILGRAGKLDEVEILIENMDLTPNALIWESVLGACKLHGNIKLGERAAKSLFQVDPEMDSTYILLSNLYASKGRWNDVSRIRVNMSNKGVKKEPGCSWVEIDAQVHVFLSQDSSHPKLLNILQKLEELGQRIAEEGYMPNIKNVLHDVPDKEKIDNLSNHSERLALGYALLNKFSSGKITIFKNLRICEDSHEFMKFVSGTVNREIIVRDTRRFHHFRLGLCSCKDYW